MAGNDQGDGIARHDTSDGARSAGMADLPGQVAVSLCCTEGYASTSPQDLVHEGAGSIEMDSRFHREIDRLTFVVSDDPFLKVFLEVFVQAEVIADGRAAVKQAVPGLFAVGNRQERPPDGLLRAG
jgi:hypothetical protein